MTDGDPIAGRNRFAQQLLFAELMITGVAAVARGGSGFLPSTAGVLVASVICLLHLPLILKVTYSSEATQSLKANGKPLWIFSLMYLLFVVMTVSMLLPWVYVPISKPFETTMVIKEVKSSRHRFINPFEVRFESTSDFNLYKPAVSREVARTLKPGKSAKLSGYESVFGRLVTSVTPGE